MRTFKKTLCLVLVLAMMLSFAAISAAAKFDDAKEITEGYTEAAEVLNAIGVLTGFEDGTFRPLGNLTREQACAIVARLLAFNGIGVASSFTDSHEWSDGYIAFCEQLAIVCGYGDGTFGPEDTLTGGQFMKMLLVALGYDPKVEGMQDVGDAWIINVARLAKQIGLDKGIADFPYLDAITREQAAQLALNALKAALVQYVAGNVSYVTTTVAGEQTIIRTRLSNSNNFTVELGERYFKQLERFDVRDAFGRSADQWKYKGNLIGTYAAKADLSYTTKVSASTIYTDLGLFAPIAADNINYFEDGVQNANWNTPINKTGTIPTIGKNGAETFVYYDSYEGTVDIIVINNYASQVVGVYGATSTKAAHVLLSTDAEKVILPAGVVNALEYNTTEFAKGDWVVYTYSKTLKAVMSMELATSVSGKLDKYTESKVDGTDGVVYVDGTAYKQNNNTIAITTDTGKIGKDITIYLDRNGYEVYSGIGHGASPYAVVTGYTDIDSSVDTINKDSVKLAIVADGSAATGTVGSTGAQLGTVGRYDIVTYQGSSSFTLKLIAKVAYFTAGDADVTLVTPGSAYLCEKFDTYGNGDDTAAKATSAIRADGETKFVILSSGVATVYDGIANVPKVTLAAGKQVTYSIAVDKDGIADVVFILKDAGVTVAGTSKDVLWFMGNTNGVTAEINGVAYYEYSALKDGQWTTVKVSANIVAAERNAITIYSEPTYNKDGIITSANGGANGNPFQKGNAGYGVGYKYVNGVATIGGSTYTFTSDVKVYSIDGMTVTPGVGDEGKALLVDDSNNMYWWVTNDKGVISEIYAMDIANSAGTTAKVTYKAILSVDDATGNLLLKVTKTEGNGEPVEIKDYTYTLFAKAATVENFTGIGPKAAPADGIILKPSAANTYYYVEVTVGGNVFQSDVELGTGAPAAK